jgi:hypothetical protein
VTFDGNEEYKPFYNYTSLDGSKFYNLSWYHESNSNNEGYEIFESLEDAEEKFGIVKKIKKSAKPTGRGFYSRIL